jgi:cytochrome c biogenesis protein CcmG/thiol:disulfide interchange protein DsbE
LTLLRRRLLRAASGCAFALSASALWVLIEHLGEQPEDTEPGPTPLIGSSAPAFSLPALGAGPGLASQDLAHAGGPVLLNFFASWCTPCALEVPVLLDLRRRGLTIWGIAYRDAPAATAAFLTAHGDPYQRVAHDDDGRTGPGFSLIGLPESFLIDPSGIVRWGWAGGLSQAVVSTSLLPRWKAAS